MVTQLIREAREGKGNLVGMGLNLVNAYSSIPPILVDVSLEIHQKVKDNQMQLEGLFWPADT